MSSRKLRICNFKSITDKTFDLNDDLNIFIGSNGTGKSTAIQAIEEVLLCKNFVKVPVQVGKTDAKVEYTGKDIEGNPIKVVMEIDQDNNYTFTAGIMSNNKVKTIHDVKKIRELLGIYYRVTVEDFLNDIRFAEGRRRVVDTLFMPLFTEEARKHLAELQLSISDKKTKATEGNLYNRRTLLNKEVETLNIQINGNKLTDEERTELLKKDAVIAYLNELEAEYKLHEADSINMAVYNKSITRLNDIAYNLNGVITELSTYKVDSKSIIGAVIINIAEEVSNIESKKTDLYTHDKLSELSDKIQRGRTKNIYLESLEKKVEPIELIKQRDAKFEELTQIEEQITTNKLGIKTIYGNSSLPAGLEIDEDTIYLNGLIMDDSVSSNTESRLAVAELLCNLTTSEYVNIGDLSLYDKVSRNKLTEIAAKHNRILLCQLVTDDKEMKLAVTIDG